MHAPHTRNTHTIVAGRLASAVRRAVGGRGRAVGGRGRAVGGRGRAVGSRGRCAAVLAARGRTLGLYGVAPGGRVRRRGRVSRVWRRRGLRVFVSALLSVGATVGDQGHALGREFVTSAVAVACGSGARAVLGRFGAVSARPLATGTRTAIRRGRRAARALGAACTVGAARTVGAACTAGGAPGDGCGKGYAGGGGGRVGGCARVRHAVAAGGGSGYVGRWMDRVRRARSFVRLLRRAGTTAGRTDWSDHRITDIRGVAWRGVAWRGAAWRQAGTARHRAASRATTRSGAPLAWPRPRGRSIPPTRASARSPSRRARATPR